MTDQHYPFKNPGPNLLGINAPIERLPLVETVVKPPSRRELMANGPAAPASSEILIARLAASRIEIEDGHHGMAAHRLAGAYDGDEPTRVALATIDVLREQGLLEAAAE